LGEDVVQRSDAVHRKFSVIGSRLSVEMRVLQI
jgi:hypothetical protein